MKEIGGYLELDQFIHNEYHPNAIALNTARNALVYLVKIKHISKIYIPYYLCDSVSNVCNREGIPYDFYHVGENFTPLFDKSLGTDEYLYVVNYFGQFDRETIYNLKTKYKRIILDNVQDFFAYPIEGIDTIYSCRKFIGVPDGAYLYINWDSSNVETLDLLSDVSMNRMRHILGRFEGSKASDYFTDFRENDELFNDLSLMHMSKLTHNILGAIDYNKVISSRNANWGILDDALCSENKLKLRTPNGPYMYPFYCENGVQMRKLLVSKKIFIPTLWSNVLNLEGCELEKDYVRNILPLPVDQRYCSNDMKIIVEEIQKCMNI